MLPTTPRKGIETNVHQLVQHCSGEQLQTSYQTTQDRLLLQPLASYLPTALLTNLSETTAWIWKVGRMEGNYREGRVWTTTSYQEQHFCSVSGFADYFELDTWRVLASQFDFKKDCYLSLLLVAHISLQSMSHSLYSNCIVSSSLRMKSMLVKNPNCLALLSRHTEHYSYSWTSHPRRCVCKHAILEWTHQLLYTRTVNMDWTLIAPSYIIQSGKQGQYFPRFSKAVKQWELSLNSAEGNQPAPFSQGADVQTG